MPRDFKSFSKENLNTEKIINENQNKANEYQDILNKYKNNVAEAFDEAKKILKLI